MLLGDFITRSLWTFQEFCRSRAKPGTIQRIQEQRLRKLLRYSAAKSPFYGDRLRGYNLDDCQLANLPMTNKAEVMAQFDRVVTDPEIRRPDLERFLDDTANIGKRFLNKYPVCHTSGSQGQPMLVVQNQLTLDLLFAFQLSRGNLNYGFGFDEGLRRIFSPGRIAVIIAKPGFYPSAWVWKHLPKSMRAFVRLLYVQANDSHLVEKLNDFRPTVLVSTPTTLDLLCRKRAKSISAHCSKSFPIANPCRTQYASDSRPRSVFLSWIHTAAESAFS